MTKWHPLYSNGMVRLSISLGNHSGPVVYRLECTGKDAVNVPADLRDTLGHTRACALHATVLAPL